MLYILRDRPQPYVSHPNPARPVRLGSMMRFSVCRPAEGKWRTRRLGPAKSQNQSKTRKLLVYNNTQHTPTYTHTYSNDDCNLYLPQRLNLSLFLFLTLSFFHFVSTVTQPWMNVPKQHSQFIVLL